MPAFEIPIQVITREASGDLSDNQYFAVMIDSSGKVALASDGEIIAGVLQDEPSAADRQCRVMTAGITKGKVGSGGVSAGETLEIASGKFVTESSGTVVGIALEEGNEDEYIPVLLK